MPRRRPLPDRRPRRDEGLERWASSMAVGLVVGLVSLALVVLLA